MQKKILLCLMFIAHSSFSEQDWYERDIPPELQELEFLDQTRFTEQLYDFYFGIKQILHNLHLAIFSSSSNLYNNLLPAHQYSTSTAYVRTALRGELCPQEHAFIQLRKQRVKRALESWLDIKLKDDAIPTIACCFSGGGFRAMIMTLGFLAAADNIGLLNSTLYLAGLSGSTWAIAPWISSGLPIHEVQTRIARSIQYGIQHLTHPRDLDQVIDLIKTKLLYNQIVSVIDIYGCILAKTILTSLLPAAQRITISETHAKVAEAHVPFPIYTSIHTKPRPYEWLEVTPFEVGSNYLQGYVPIWAFGRKFKNGVSQDRAPEQTMGYFLGIFGSAFEVSLKDVISMTASNLTKIKSGIPDFIGMPLQEAVKLILNTALGDIRLFPAMLANYSYQFSPSPEKDNKMLEYVDAGIDFNLPLVPLLKKSRAIDLIIIYDASATVNGAPELKRAQAYAARKGIKLPPIDFQNIDKKPISIFKDENDPSIPVLVYIPRIKNERYSSLFDPEECVAYDFCNTFNFAYSLPQFKMLSGLTEFTIQDNESIIKESIRDILITKYRYQF